MKRTIIIGDVHGCYEELMELLEKCKVTPQDDVLLLGDVVDRGPDSGKCMDFVIRRERLQGSPASILGNHEEKHLAYLDMEREKRMPKTLPPTHVITREQMKPEHYECMRRMPLFVRYPELGAAAVHAGAFPWRPLEQQRKQHLLHIQCIKPYDYDEKGSLAVNEKSMWPSKVKDAERDHWKFWHKFWTGPERIIFGHSVLSEPLVKPLAVGLDGGCVFGMQLLALELPSWELVSVESKQPNDRDQSKKISQHSNVQQYPVDDGVWTYS